MEQRLCECGCGNEVTWNKWKSRWNKYINGHQRRGFKATEETRAKCRERMLGTKMSEETKRKMSLASLGKKKSDEHCKNISISQTGKKMSKASRLKMSKARMGVEPWNKGQMFPERMKPNRYGYCDAWEDPEYKNDCLKDTCEICGKKLEIKPTINKDRRYSTLCLHHIDEDKTNCHPDNLQTLCVSCHATIHWELRKQNVNHLR